MTRKRAVLLSVAAAAAVVLPVAADRVTKEVIEHKIAAQLACAAGLNTAPDVSFGGFPFLTQVAAKTVSDVRISADDVTVKDVRLAHLSAHATDLRLASPPSASAIAIDATLGYDSLNTLLATRAGTGAGALLNGGTPNESDGSGNKSDGSANSGGAANKSDGSANSGDKADSGDKNSSGDKADSAAALKEALSGATIGGDDRGRLVISAKLPVQGTSMPVTIYADLGVSGGKLTVKPSEVEVSAFGLRVPAERLGTLGQEHTIALPTVPGGFTIRSIEARPDGLRIAAEGAGVTADFRGEHPPGTLPRCRS